MLVNLLGFAIFAALGFFVARFLPAPRPWWVPVAALALLVIAPYIGVSARLIDIGGLVIYFNVALQGFLFGVLAKWLSKK